MGTASEDKIANNGTTTAKNIKQRNNPNIFSRMFLWWMCPVLIKGNKRDIQEDDLIRPTPEYDSEIIGEYFEKHWFEEVHRASSEKRQPSLWRTMWNAYWHVYMPSGIYVVTMSVLRAGQPLVFAQLLSYWSVNSTIGREEAGFYALAMLGINFISMMCNHHHTHFVLRFSMRMKVACSSLLYRKLLRASLVSAGDVAGGKLVNLLSNDMARFEYALMFLHHLWVVPIQLAVILYFLYQVAGYAPFVGFFGVVMLIFPLQAVLTKLTADVRRDIAQKTDNRIKLMSEIINGIQVIKMYAWEKPFEVVIKAARACEMSSLRKSVFIRNTFLGYMMFTDRSILFFTILTLALSGNLITAAQIYPIQQYFSVIQMSVTMIYPLAIASISEMTVSLERIKSFLLIDEREDISKSPKRIRIDTLNEKLEDKKKIKKDLNSVDLKKCCAHENSPVSVLVSNETAELEYPIEIQKVNASWTGSQDEMTLKNISLRIRKGKLCSIVGPVGSGKSSLLQVLLKELAICQGSVSIHGRVSYACQESWLFPGTVRENILFGTPYDSHRYKEVCDVCCLLPDFKQFPYGDLTLVGERGVSLSGGQKARINLARAIYRKADVYLLDDPLSAVDANVGRLLFEGCIKGYLRGHTCILVTHQIHFLKAADQIVVLNEGAIENLGTYDELVKSGTEFSQLLPEQSVAGLSAEGEVAKKPSLSRGLSKTSIKSEELQYEQAVQVQEAEERAKGSLKWAVVFQYLTSVKSWCVVFMAALILFITQGLVTSADYWISFWTNQVDAYVKSLAPGIEPDTSLDVLIGSLTTTQYLYIYGTVLMAIILFANLRIYAFVVMTMRASQNLHDIIYQNLSSALMRFFDTNPSGRVLNRFSKDMGTMDELLPRSMLEIVQMYLSLISILVLNAIALPLTLIPTAGLMVIFVFLLKWYINAAQAVKRLEGTTKSPVFGMINSTISGLSTIRSSDAQSRLLRMFDNTQNLNTSAFYTFVGGSTAFGLYLDCLCIFYLGIIITIFLVIDVSTLIPVGSVGLAVSQSMVLTMMLQMAARFTADFLGQMTAVERVLEYTQLPSEENMETGPTVPPEEWPSEGTVEFENVFLKYGPEDPPVLKNLNLVINSGWKVGVVGRTGAGKSSLIAALFRLHDISGNIKIDGIDTKDLSKRVLRSKLSIIPQEPVLFSASVRYNLDPFNDYSDDDIWRALEQVELKEAIPALDFRVSEGGSNFSIGQRQLVCLARAVLRSNKILIMDEATANVDPQTDALIQQTIRRAFSACTVLTIAHRLNTVMDSDRVLVMDRGQALEFDRPYALLANPASKFSFMVNETGDSMKNVLFEIAKSKYYNENKQ